MRAIAYQAPSAGQPVTLVETEVPKPIATGRDLLVAIKAISVNPIDTKVRKSFVPESGAWKILGWDAAGIVVSAGPDAKAFKIGDEVYYAGAVARPGTNAEFNLVDERIVGRKPASLSWTEAAALPLTSLTAWEMLFDRLRIKDPVASGAPAIVIIGAGGGVGSIAVQLARRLTDLTVIATASRPETRTWVEQLGAHHVVDHGKPIGAQIAALKIGQPSFVFSVTQTDRHLAEVADFIAPQGRFGLIDDPATLEIKPFKRKAVSVHWENMFTRSTFQTPDMDVQGTILNEIARLADAGTLRTTANDSFGRISADNIRKAHAILENGTATGKIVMDGFA